MLSRVTLFFRNLFSCFLLCFIFFGVLPGCALALDGDVIFSKFEVNENGTIRPVSYSDGPGASSDIINNYGLGSLFYSGTLVTSPTTIFFDIKSNPISYTTDSDECTLYLDLSMYVFPVHWYNSEKLMYGDPYVLYPYPNTFNFTVNFSDGTTKTFGFVNSHNPYFRNSPLTITLKKTASNEYILTSDDFNLSGDSASISTNSVSGENGADVPLGRIVMQQGNISSQLATFRPISGTNVGTFGASLADISSAMADITLTSANFSLSKGTVAPSTVQLSPGSSVYITSVSFSCSGQTRTVQYNFDYSKPLPYVSGYGAAVENSLATQLYYFPTFRVSYDFSGGDGSAGFLGSILHTLRYELPQQLKHLIIPTAEEVQDVLTEASDEIKNNAGGLGQAWDMVDTEFKELQQAIGSGEADPVVIPAIEFDCFGIEVKLWDDTDFTPYLDTPIVRVIMVPAELMTIYVLAKYLLRHFYLMYVCLTSGMSYGAFLRYLTSKVD